ncbi:hypothetical protein ScalyP_jg569, partial [Parmales sp. scaly parma]
AGSSGGQVKLLDETLTELRAFDLGKIFPQANGRSVKALSLNKDGRKVMVSTKGGEIYEFTNPPLGAGGGAGDEELEPADVNSGPLATGHSSDQLWGLAAHPIKEEYATVGDDKKVNLWDLASHQLVRSLNVGDFGRACGYSPNGHLLAVGMGGVRNGGSAAGYEDPGKGGGGGG